MLLTQLLNPGADPLPAAPASAAGQAADGESDLLFPRLLDQGLSAFPVGRPVTGAGGGKILPPPGKDDPPGDGESAVGALAFEFMPVPQAEPGPVAETRASARAMEAVLAAETAPLLHAEGANPLPAPAGADPVPDPKAILDELQAPVVAVRETGTSQAVSRSAQMDAPAGDKRRLRPELGKPDGEPLRSTPVEETEILQVSEASTPTIAKSAVKMSETHLEGSRSAVAPHKEPPPATQRPREQIATTPLETALSNTSAPSRFQPQAADPDPADAAPVPRPKLAARSKEALVASREAGAPRTVVETTPQASRSPIETAVAQSRGEHARQPEHHAGAPAGDRPQKAPLGAHSPTPRPVAAQTPNRSTAATIPSQAEIRLAATAPGATPPDTGDVKKAGARRPSRAAANETAPPVAADRPREQAAERAVRNRTSMPSQPPIDRPAPTEERSATAMFTAPSPRSRQEEQPPDEPPPGLITGKPDENAHLRPRLAPEAPSVAPAPKPLEIKVPVGQQAWADQLARQLGGLAEAGGGEARIRLHPEHLGPLEVRVQTQGRDTHIQLQTSHDQVREALEAALPRLRESLQGSGFHLAAVDLGRQPVPGQTPTGTPGQGAFQGFGAQHQAPGDQGGGRHSTPQSAWQQSATADSEALAEGFTEQRQPGRRGEIDYWL